MFKKELFEFKNCFNKIETLYIGGGTPNSLSVKEMRDFLFSIKELVSFENLREFTIECNPDCWKKDHLKVFDEFKVNRISLGIQTTNNDINYTCNRMQTVKMVEDAIKDIRESTFQIELSFDFILNLFNQKKVDIKSDLEFIKKYKPNHISWYSLILKKGTPLSKKHKNLEDNDYSFSVLVDNELEKQGYSKYEVSSYSLEKRFESIHNKAYWLSKQYLGIGWGSASLLKVNDSYLLRTIKGTLSNPIEEIEVLSKEKFLFQTLMMGLRLEGGVNIKKSPHKEAALYFKKKIDKLIKDKKLIIHNDHLFVTSEHKNFLNDILVEIL